MQLELTRKEQKRGLIFKKTNYVIRSRLITTESEKHALEEANVKNLSVFEPYTFRGEQYGSKVSWWINSGISAPVESLQEAHEIEEQIKIAAQRIKERVDSLLEGGLEKEKSETIDL